MTTAVRTRQILLVDDHVLFRSGLRLLLESAIECEIVEASDAREAVDIATSRTFDVVLVDVCMPGHDGLWALERLHRHASDLPVVMLSTFADPPSVRGSLDLGAAGYLVKDAEVHQVVDSIETAIDGNGIYLHPLAAQAMIDAPVTGDPLTEREREVLSMVVRGATNEEIASALYITDKTVKTHVTAILRKLGVTNRTQAATKALRDGIVAT